MDICYIYLISIPTIFLLGLIVIGYFWSDFDPINAITTLGLIAVAWFFIIPVAILWGICYLFYKLGIILKNSSQKLKENK
jgi:hypothetical protein